MKHIFLFLSLLFAVQIGQSQTYGSMILKDPSQNADTASVLVMFPTGHGALTGRGHFISYETFAALIEPYLAGGAISDGDKGDITVIGSGATWTVDNGLAATKIADGSVSNAEFQYIGGLTSDAQTQLGSKAASGANTDINSVALDNTGLKIKDGTKKLTISSSSGLSADRTLTIDVNNLDQTLDLEAGLHVVGAGPEATIAAGSSVLGSNTGDQDLSGYATTGALALKVNISDTASMLSNYPTKGEAVLLTTDQSVNGEKTFNDSLRVDDYALFMGLNGGVATMIEMLKDGTLRIDSDNGSAGDGRVYMRMNPYTSADNNTSFNFSMTRQDNAGITRDNDVFNMGFNLAGGGNLERDNIGETAMGLSFENFFRTSGSDYSEFHLFFIDSNDVQYRPITFYLNRYNPLLWTGAFHVPEFEFRPPSDVDPYVEFTNPDGIRSQMKLLNPVDNKGAGFLADPASNLLQIYPQGMTDSELNMKSFEYAEVKRLQATTSFGGTADKLWGESSGGWHEKITLGWGVDLTGNSLVADSSQVASVFANSLKANDVDVVHDTGVETIAGVKTFSSDPIVPAEAYDATGWNGSNEPATKNDIRDKIESLSSGGMTFQQAYAISSLRL